jgi:hydroxymethylpyrimidine/phosphomethylpyrimidine kinase
VLASGIATGLAQGKSLERAVAVAREFLHLSLRGDRAVRWGASGPAFAG